MAPTKKMPMIPSRLSRDLIPANPARLGARGGFLGINWTTSLWHSSLVGTIRWADTTRLVRGSFDIRVTLAPFENVEGWTASVLLPNVPGQKWFCAGLIQPKNQASTTCSEHYSSHNVTLARRGS